MPAVLTPHQDGTEVLVPDWIVDNASFLRWAESDEAPTRGKIGYFQGRVWVDQTMEAKLHNLIKMAIAKQVMVWSEDNDLGQYYGDGMLFSSPEHELSCEPDGLFVTTATQALGKVWFDPSREKILFGVPDMVLEVVSPSSVQKDLKRLRPLYHQAGVTEYWIVNSLDASPELVINQHNANGYLPIAPSAGWVYSQVLGASFRLSISDNQTKVRLERK
ncbi:MAG: Uma2 family endonuclease [Gemmatales bacterium]